ncbi:MAG: ATP-grasp domain-containing protein [Deltaproteobacteria bacterium]|nr:ATP-grasp domain-containing protein [Deltaproteobacteria bacterium]
MHWILQENLFKEAEWANLVGALERFSLPYSVHKVVPFVGELVPPAEIAGGKVVCFGSYSLRHAARAAGWTPGVYDLDDADFEVQRAHWGARMLNAASVVVRFADVRFSTAAPYFVRPIRDSKVFAGQTVDDQAEFYAWQHRVCALGEDTGTSLAPDTLVQVAPVREIYTEVRCWVVGGQIVTASQYKLGSKVTYASVPRDSALVAYAQARVAEWQPHRAFCLDVADTADGPAIVEINTINAAGFYAADVQKLVIALEEIEA